jgi:hypothetical protein
MTGLVTPIQRDDAAGAAAEYAFGFNPPTRFGISQLQRPPFMTQAFNAANLPRSLLAE